MSSSGVSGVAEEADPFAVIAAALAAVEAVDLAAVSPAECAEHLRRVEQTAAQVAAVACALHDQVDRGDLHRPDGHVSPRTMIGHLGRLPHPEAAARHQMMLALRDLPLTADALRAGRIGAAQARRLARAWANPRVRDLLVEVEPEFVDLAASVSYRWFAESVSAWERLADQDGTIDADQVATDFRLVRLPDGTWEPRGRLRSAEGAILDDIFAHFVDAELRADWDAARAEHGDAATLADLPRTAAQRRADACKHLFLDAASAPPGSREPRLVINILITMGEFLRQLAILAGHNPDHTDTPGADATDPADSTDTAPAGAEPAGAEPPSSGPRPDTPPPRLPPPLGPSRRPDGTPIPAAPPTARTANGTPIDPWDIAALAVGADLRRLVIGADSTTIDLGTRARLYTGNARDAIMLPHPECAWAGCARPTRHCQADHLTPHSHGGATTPTNGAPLCGHHNRHKHTHRYTVWRDPNGTWHTTRPDGTEV